VANNFFSLSPSLCASLSRIKKVALERDCRHGLLRFPVLNAMLSSSNLPLCSGTTPRRNLIASWREMNNWTRSFGRSVTDWRGVRSTQHVIRPHRRRRHTSPAPPPPAAAADAAGRMMLGGQTVATMCQLRVQWRRQLSKSMSSTHWRPTDETRSYCLQVRLCFFLPRYNGKCHTIKIPSYNVFMID